MDASKKIRDRSQQIVDNIKHKIDARTEFCQRVADLMRESYTRYYDRHPERAVDDRGADATEWSANGLQSIFNIAGDYNITYRDGVNEVPLSVQIEETKRDTDDKRAPTTSSEVI